MKNKKYTFYVQGMHCSSCELMIESELKELQNIKEVKSNLKNNSVDIIGDFGNKTNKEIVEELTNYIKQHGYTLSIEKEKKIVEWKDFKIAIPTAVLFVIFFIFLQKIGIVNIVDSSKLNYGTVFMIGIVASLSSCMAVVGGILLSMSATFVKEGDQVKPQLLFHIGRIVSFFILGGIIGIIGSAFTLNTSLIFILSLLIGIVMLILGINLLDIFHFTKKLQPSMPKFISTKANNISKLNHTFTPLLIGIATFFLPCGFTQSMQIYALSTGNFLSGALTMLIFALGTFPVLALISFSSLSIKNSSTSGVFLKSAGLIVIMFAIFNIINSLVVIGIISPVFNF